MERLELFQEMCGICNALEACAMSSSYDPEPLSTFGRCRHCGCLAAMHNQDGRCFTVEELCAWLRRRWRNAP